MSEIALKDIIHMTITRYYQNHEDKYGNPKNVYPLVMNKIIPAVIEATLWHTRDKMGKANQSQAALILGVSRGRLLAWLKKYNIQHLGLE